MAKRKYVIKMKNAKMEIDGSSIIKKKVSAHSGWNGRVFVPVSWIGKNVVVILLDDIKED